ncbi:hypothetical protein RDI58_010199 [Solanum bulbocastanum]|uniref:Uncharacterized protein n=1 Tax=Solanum bulbocastanum TaxID=147425 RepID=A0AAN8TMF4_SOLBU
MNVFPNSRNIETTQATPPIENPIELLVNEAFGGLRHEGVDVGPSPKDDVNAETCKYCHTSRWKPKKKSNTDHTLTTKHMRWHAEYDNKDRTLRHPKDGPRASENNIDVYL